MEGEEKITDGYIIFDVNIAGKANISCPFLSGIARSFKNQTAVCLQLGLSQIK